MSEPSPGEVSAVLRKALERVVRQTFPDWEVLPDDRIQLRQRLAGEPVEITVERSDGSESSTAWWELSAPSEWFAGMLEELGE